MSDKRFPTTHDPYVSMIGYYPQSYMDMVPRMLQAVRQLTPEEETRLKEARKKRAEYEALSPVKRLFVDEPPKV